MSTKYQPDDFKFKVSLDCIEKFGFSNWFSNINSIVVFLILFFVIILEETLSYEDKSYDKVTNICIRVVTPFFIIFDKNFILFLLFNKATSLLSIHIY